ncbi:MAG: hypothetical protein HUU54_10645 [Ignavibacteriaceae bacterium]|nr:hypothetical protein [Ignavibacteriaceae bacterium]
MKKDIISKYLAKYQYGKYTIEKNFSSLKKAVVVVPCFNESDNLPVLIQSLSQNSPESLSATAFLFVINSNVNTAPGVKEDNLRAINFLRNRMNQFDGNPGGLSIGIIDASSNGYALDDKTGGVGLARKIGMDAALSFLCGDNINDGLIVSLDADCTVSQSYLETIFASMADKTDFATIRYSHQASSDVEINNSIIAYEIFLRYYYLGLTYAGSSYALHTIGSAFVCRPGIYMKCEGMNKRKAGEDFYFIEKMAKQGSHKYIKNCAVYPSPRPSDRVPFGTGKAVQNHLLNPEKRNLVYNPEVFLILKRFLELLSGLRSETERFMYQCNKIDKAVVRFLEINNFKSQWINILGKTAKEDQLERQKRLWFDGFRTLKFVHYLRDNGYPNIASGAALSRLISLAKEKMNLPEAEGRLLHDPQTAINYLREIT